MSKSLKEKFSNFITTFLIASIISFIYIKMVYPDFSYTGLRVNENLNRYYLLFLMVVAAAPSIFLPRYFYWPSSVLIWLSFYLIYMPSVVLHYISGIVVGIDSFMFSLVMLICITIITLVPRLKLYKNSNMELESRSYFLILLMFGFLCYAVIFGFYKPNVSNLLNIGNVTELYDIRGKFREVSTNIPSIARYIFAWSSKIILPLFMVYALSKKNKIYLAASIFTGFMIFAATGLKSVFLGPILVYLCWKYLTKESLTFNKLNYYLFLFLVISTVLYFWGFPQINDVIIRRVLIIPGYLTGAYVDFFGENGHTFLGYSILGGLIDYQYSVTPPFVIGEAYFGRIDMSANANFLASVYGDFGYIGCVVFSIFIAGIFGFIDKVAISREVAPQLTAVFLLPTWTLVDTSLLTSLLTHGLGIMMILSLVVPRRFFTK